MKFPGSKENILLKQVFPLGGRPVVNSGFKEECKSNSALPIYLSIDLISDAKINPLSCLEKKSGFWPKLSLARKTLLSFLS